ncbi:unnamed protein product [Amoebophrya sp. A120]|nr:unnamed protein product [Amoebophrya sp. A120]|eukprot:GSA120T00013239001.1
MGENPPDSGSADTLPAAELARTSPEQNTTAKVELIKPPVATTTTAAAAAASPTSPMQPSAASPPAPGAAEQAASPPPVQIPSPGGTAVTATNPPAHPTAALSPGMAAALPMALSPQHQEKLQSDNEYKMQMMNLLYAQNAYMLTTMELLQWQSVYQNLQTAYKEEQMMQSMNQYFALTQNTAYYAGMMAQAGILGGGGVVPPIQHPATTPLGGVPPLYTTGASTASPLGGPPPRAGLYHHPGAGGLPPAGTPTSPSGNHSGAGIAGASRPGVVGGTQKSSSSSGGKEKKSVFCRHAPQHMTIPSYRDDPQYRETVFQHAGSTGNTPTAGTGPPGGVSSASTTSRGSSFRKQPVTNLRGEFDETGRQKRPAFLPADHIPFSPKSGKHKIRLPGESEDEEKEEKPTLRQRIFGGGKKSTSKTKTASSTSSSTASRSASAATSSADGNGSGSTSSSPRKEGNENNGDPDGPTAVEETAEEKMKPNSKYHKQLEEKKKLGEVSLTAQEEKDLKTLNEKKKKNSWWRRYRVGFVLKIALIMVLLEVKLGWFLVYMVGVVLFFLGYLDFFESWANNTTKKFPPLSEQLLMLASLREKLRMDSMKNEERERKRKGYREAGEEVPEFLLEKNDEKESAPKYLPGTEPEGVEKKKTTTEKTTSFSSTTTSSCNSESPTKVEPAAKDPQGGLELTEQKSSSSTLTSDPNPNEPEQNAFSPEDGAKGGAASKAENDGSTPSFKEGTTSTSKEKNEEKNKPEEEPVEKPFNYKDPCLLVIPDNQYGKHFFYQLVICFLFTLNPAWTPNPVRLGLYCPGCLGDEEPGAEKKDGNNANNAGADANNAGNAEGGGDDNDGAGAGLAGFLFDDAAG